MARNEVCVRWLARELLPPLVEDTPQSVGYCPRIRVPGGDGENELVLTTRMSLETLDGFRRETRDRSVGTSGAT